LYRTQHDEENPPNSGKNEAIVTSGIRKETDIHYGAMRSKQLRQSTERQLMPNTRNVRKTLDAVQTNSFEMFYILDLWQAETSRDIKRPLIQIPQHYFICVLFVS
jgi:hypothetical protein